MVCFIESWIIIFKFVYIIGCVLTFFPNFSALMYYICFTKKHAGIIFLLSIPCICHFIVYSKLSHFEKEIYILQIFLKKKKIWNNFPNIFYTFLHMLFQIYSKLYHLERKVIFIITFYKLMLHFIG